MEYFITDRDRRRLHGRAFRAEQRGHHEVGGLLLADRRNQLHLVFLKNQSTRAYHYEALPADVRSASEGTRGGPLSAVGSFHSHPLGDAALSRGDRKVSSAGQLTLVYDVCGREARLWRVIRKAGKRKVVGVALGRTK